MLDVEGFILVGGLSSRMGTNKSELRLDGQTAVERIEGQLCDVADRVRLVGPHSGQTANIPDVHENWGPLGGIQAALAAANSEWCLIVACDLPFVTRELFARLMEFCNDSTDAIVPLQEDARPQPLCSLYRRERCSRAAEQSIANDEHTPRALLDKVNTRYIEFSELSDLIGAEHFFFNMNTPENYERATEIARLLQNGS
jgi:molybdopterin-guanine dinucleotide biosynthesis protein A